jgi:hypothetical protein
MEKCPNCGKVVEKLIPIDNAHVSAEITELIGVAYPSIDHYCITCARQMIGISDEDLIKEDRILSKNPDFIISLLKGRIGQVILESIFANFGYEVYQYGYESHLTNIIKSLRKNWSNQAIRQIRSTPDMLIYDKEHNDGFLIEAKSTTLKPENYWIESKQLKNYKELWGSAVLTIIHFPTLRVFCKTFNKIILESLIETSPSFAPELKGYKLNLVEHFSELSQQFRLIKKDELIDFLDRIKTEILIKYGS